MVRSLHETWAAGDRVLVLGQDTEPAGDFRISLDQSAHVPAEPVLVELVLGLDVPEAAGIRGDLVGHDDAHHLAFPETAGLELEVHEADADAEEEAGQKVV